MSEKSLPEKSLKTEKNPARPGKEESRYSLRQLTEGYRALGTSREIVAAALKQSGRAQFTLDEARRLVDKFKDQEVK